MEAEVALVTEGRYVADEAPAGDWYLENILADDRLVIAALARRGLSARRVDWAAPGVDWGAFRCAVLRTTWDYFDRFAEFSPWLARVAARTRLCNELALVRWNIDKHYLRDLAAAGVPVVPTRFLERGATASLAGLLEETGWEEAVLKPCVSGAARHTYRVDRAGAGALEGLLARLLADEAMMLQPFQRDVLVGGEVTVVAIDGRATHGVRKLARPGDFRVQDDFGGTVHAHAPRREEVALAEAAMAACSARPVYGRVDMVRGDDGRLLVMELELVEPELWYRMHPPAAEAFAEALVRWLG
ncbi:MAG: hypothetical protein KC636_01770 [Myxococcales bacterium]|nr:hypothetical protein [Myxococcales bacterium]